MRRGFDRSFGEVHPSHLIAAQCRSTDACIHLCRCVAELDTSRYHLSVEPSYRRNAFFTMTPDMASTT